MRLRRIVVALALVAAAVLGIAGGGVASATGQARIAPSVVFGPPAEGTKVTLWGETSIDGPALWTTFTHPSIASVLAWTGTDSQHHLNFMTSGDGLHYGNKHTLAETSPWRPAVAFNLSLRGDPYGQIILAWAGTDQAHTLNVEYISTPDYQVVKKFTFWGDTTFTAPTLMVLNDTVTVGWAGTDSSHTLNLISVSRFLQVGTKLTLWGWGSSAQPNLSYDWASGSALLAWTGANHRLSFAQSTDQRNWTMPLTSPLSAQSAWAPSMAGLFASNMPTHWLTWTSMSASSNQQVVVQYTESFPSWVNANSQTVLQETSAFGPELGYIGTNRQVLVAWSGTDGAHTLNISTITC